MLLKIEQTNRDTVKKCNEVPFFSNTSPSSLLSLPPLQWHQTWQCANRQRRSHKTGWLWVLSENGLKGESQLHHSSRNPRLHLPGNLAGLLFVISTYSSYPQLFQYLCFLSYFLVYGYAIAWRPFYCTELWAYQRCHTCYTCVYLSVPIFTTIYLFCGFADPHI